VLARSNKGSTARIVAEVDDGRDPESVRPEQQTMIEKPAGVPDTHALRYTLRAVRAKVRWRSLGTGRLGLISLESASMRDADAVDLRGGAKCDMADG
jgi:hypothetical protein